MNEVAICGLFGLVEANRNNVHKLSRDLSCLLGRVLFKGAAVGRRLMSVTALKLGQLRNWEKNVRCLAESRLVTQAILRLL
jgi:hypothetical protein